MKKEGIRSQRWWLLKVVAPAVAVFILAIASVAQEGLTIRQNANQEWPSAEAGKVYVSACTAVQRELGISRELRPQVTLVLGAKKEGVDLISERSGWPNGIGSSLPREWYGWPLKNLCQKNKYWRWRSAL